MATQKVNLAVIFRNPSNDTEVLLIKKTPPPCFNDPEYDSYKDSDLWDLPSVQLSLKSSIDCRSGVHVEGVEDSSVEFLRCFDLDSALIQVLPLVGFVDIPDIKWSLSKIVEEPEFGPGIPEKTVYLSGAMELRGFQLEDNCKWMSNDACVTLLQEVKPQNDRIGPLVVIGYLNELNKISEFCAAPNLKSQEYPPGIKVVPMRSRTAKPFHATNLIVLVSENNHGSFNGDDFVASGDALIIDPGCSSVMHKELEDIVSALPRKLLVFVTHHHYDHIDGLSVVQKCNPDAVLLAHENTSQRIPKEDWSSRHIPLVGFQEICVGDQRLRIIAAPGHTDGHLALLHVSTNTLIVGDHCVGQGSAVLDITSGGNMSDYFRTTYELMDLSPHVLIPMHGRTNMWPKHMLCGYLKNRRKRESTILEAIQNGTRTLFDIVAYTYSDVDRSVWLHAASNVRLHIEHLAVQGKLPEEFSLLKFQSSCKMNFFLLWIWECLRTRFPAAITVVAGVVAGAAILYSGKVILSRNKE